jgi:hypothetical protein
LLKNKLFVAILFMILAVQLFAVIVASSMFNAVSLTLAEWGWCTIFALINLPLVFFSRLLFRFWRRRVSASSVANEDVSPEKQNTLVQADPAQVGSSDSVSFPEGVRGKMRARRALPTKANSLASLKTNGSKG